MVYKLTQPSSPLKFMVHVDASTIGMDPTHWLYTFTFGPVLIRDH